jgi:hypothetical protein
MIDFLKIDNSKIKQQHSAAYIIGMLRGFVPEKLHNEFRDFVMDEFAKNELELSTGNQRKEYEAFKKQCLELNFRLPEVKE